MSTATDPSSRAFSPVVMVAVVLVGLLSFLGMGLLAAYSPNVRSGDDGRTHALSLSATGYSGIVALLRDVDVPVVLNRATLGPETDESLLIVTPAVGQSPPDLEVFDHAGPTLVILPKWQDLPDPGHRGWVQLAGTIEGDDAVAILPDGTRLDTTISARSGTSQVQLSTLDGDSLGRPVEVEGLRTIKGRDWDPVIVDAAGEAVLAQHRGTGIYVLADPDFLNTQGLRTVEGAGTAVAMIEAVRTPDTPIIFDLTLHGFSSARNLLRLLVDPPLVGMTIAMVVLAAFVGLQAAIRFGPPAQSERVVALGKRALADNTAGLVRLARREHHMATPYAQLTRSLAARAIGAPRNLGDAELDAFLDRVGTTAGVTTPYSTLAARAAAATSAGDLVRVAADLYRWKQELTRGRH